MAKRILDYFHVGETEPVMDVDGLIIRGSEVLNYENERILISPKYSNGGGKARKIEIPGFLRDERGRSHNDVAISSVEKITDKYAKEGIRKLLEERGLEGQVEFW